MDKPEQGPRVAVGLPKGVADLRGRADQLAYRPERLFIDARDAKAWIINDIKVVHVVDETLLASWYLDRRKAGRKIRQQRRRIRRVNLEFSTTLEAPSAGGTMDFLVTPRSTDG